MIYYNTLTGSGGIEPEPAEPNRVGTEPAEPRRRFRPQEPEPAGTGTGWNRLVWPHERCAVATQDVCCGKTRPPWWQETREPQRGAAAEGGRLPCLLPPQTSCLATTDILCCHSTPLV